MSSPAVVVIDDKSKPANIPDCATIITQCFALGPQQVTATNVSGVRIDLQPTSRSVHDASTIWVKFGCTITMGEAKTQRYVAQYLRDHDNPAVRLPRVYLAFTWGVFGFIVAEYIDGQICDYSDIPLVAAAVQALIAIPSPGPKPGRVGGGRIEHPFFIDRMSSIEYESVEELQDHINGILSVTGKGGHVDFSDELAQYGLRLCVSDLQPVNFMKDGDGRIVAVDCGGYSFLPPSFFGLALKFGDFAHRLSTILQFPCTNVAALMSASCALVPFSSNDIGGQISFFSLSLFLDKNERRVYCTTAQGFRDGSGPGVLIIQTRRTNRPPSPNPNRTAFSFQLVRYVRTCRDSSMSIPRAPRDVAFHLPLSLELRAFTNLPSAPRHAFESATIWSRGAPCRPAETRTRVVPLPPSARPPSLAVRRF